MGVAVGMYLLSHQDIAEHGANGVQAVEPVVAEVVDEDLSGNVASSTARVTTAVWNYRSTQKLNFEWTTRKCDGKGTRKSKIPQTHKYCSDLGYPIEFQAKVEPFSLQTDTEDGTDQGEDSQHAARNVVAEFMLGTLNSAQSAAAIVAFAKRLNIGERSAHRFVHATAELCCRAQALVAEEVLRYAWTMIEMQSWKPVCYINYQAYDETPLRLRLQFHENEAEPQVGKVFVVKSKWAMVLQETDGAKQLFSFHGSWSDALRVVDRTTATGIAMVLSTCPRPPKRVEDMFDMKLRVAESDGLLANQAAERLTMTSLSDEGWCAVQYLCTGHRVHAVAEKVWSLEEAALSGVVRTLLVLQNSTTLSAFRRALEMTLQERMRVVQGEPLLTSAALEYRANVLRTFAPNRKHPRQLAVLAVFASVFNGDWRDINQITHFCRDPRCCGSIAEAKMKMKQSLLCLLQTWRPRRICKGNCCPLQAPLRNVFADFETKLRESGDVEVDDGGDADRDAQRGENDEHRRSALEFFEGSGLERLYIVRTVLAPQVELIHQVLALNEAEFDAREGGNESPSFRVVELIRASQPGKMFHAFLKKTALVSTSTTLWVHCASTESFATDVFRFCTHAAAVLKELVLQQWAVFPQKLFSMLDSAAARHEIYRIYRESPCLLDEWSKAFLDKFCGEAGLDGLLDPAASAVVNSMAALVVGNIFNVERTHSKHARRVQHRVTHQLLLEDLACWHQTLSGPLAWSHAVESKVFTLSLNSSQKPCSRIWFLFHNTCVLTLDVSQRFVSVALQLLQKLALD
eukprot:2947479-Amphidinium_carterae.1